MVAMVVEPMTMLEKRPVRHSQKQPELEEPTKEEKADDRNKGKNAGGDIPVGEPLPGQKIPPLLAKKISILEKCQLFHVPARVAAD